LTRLIRLSDLIAGAERAVADLRNGKMPDIGDIDAADSLQRPPAPSGAPELISWDDDGAAEADEAPPQPEAPVSPLDDLAGLSFHSLAPPLAGGTLPPPSPAAAGTLPRTQSQPMSNPSLPANAQQARVGRAPDKQKDAFDFSDLLSVAKAASRAQPPPHPAASAEATPVDPHAAPNAPRTTSWGASPDPSNGSGNSAGSLIDFMS
ncbi:hypothetical protein H4R19_006057, partial [Coemansia spiralis]